MLPSPPRVTAFHSPQLGQLTTWGGLSHNGTGNKRLNSQLFSFKIEFWNSWQRQRVKTIALNKRVLIEELVFLLYTRQKYSWRERRSRESGDGGRIGTLPASSRTTASGVPEKEGMCPVSCLAASWGSFRGLGGRIEERHLHGSFVIWGPGDQSQDS